MGTSKMEREVKAAVKKHLPSQVAGEMNIFFEEHNQLKREKKEGEKKIQTLEEDLEKQKKENEELSRELKFQHELDERKAKLDEREKDLEQRARNLTFDEMHHRVNLLEYELQAERKYGEKVTDFMLNLSKNSVVKKRFAGEIPVGASATQEYDYENRIRKADSWPETRQVKQTTTISEEPEEESQ